MKDIKGVVWNDMPEYGELFFNRATGKLEEMESSKAAVKVLGSFYKNGMKILDVGCGAGHYLRSLISRLDENVDYTGVDATPYYVELAKKAYNNKYEFFEGSIFDLPFEDNSFDIVMCNNVLLHLPPPLETPISELIRVSKKNVLIRTTFGERNYIVKELRDTESANEIIARKDDESLTNFNYFNMYTQDYVENTISKINKNAEVDIKKDTDWESFNNTDLTTNTGTKTSSLGQVSGNLILDWRFIKITL